MTESSDTTFMPTIQRDFPIGRPSAPPMIGCTPASTAQQDGPVRRARGRRHHRSSSSASTATATAARSRTSRRSRRHCRRHARTARSRSPRRCGTNIGAQPLERQIATPSRVSPTTFSARPMAAGRTTKAPMAISPSMSPNARSRSITTSATLLRIYPTRTSEEAAMGHCYHHALSSVKKWGGVAEDYLPLHQWFDEVESDHGRLSSSGSAASCRRHLHAGALLRRDDHHLDRARRSGAADRRTACDRGSRLHSELRRLGALHPARTLDGPSTTDPQTGRSLRGHTSGGA